MTENKFYERICNYKLMYSAIFYSHLLTFKKKKKKAVGNLPE